MPSEWYSIPSFGGGLNFAAHPAAIKDDEWSWAQNWYARDGYAECAVGYDNIGSSAVATSDVAGAFQSAFTVSAPLVIVWVNRTTGAVVLQTVTPGGVFTNITWDAVGAQPLGGTLATSNGNAVHTAFINGVQIISLGITGRAASSLIAWGGGATYANLGADATGLNLQANYMGALGQRLILAAVATGAGPTRTDRKVWWSDANTQTVWTPAVSNSADFEFLNEVDAAPIATAKVGSNAFGIFTRKGLYVLQPTGGIPAFTMGFEASIQAESDFSSGGSFVSTYLAPPLCESAAGLFYTGADDVYQFPRESVGEKVFRYIQKIRNSNTESETRFYVWHATRSMMMIGMNGGAEYMLFHPKTGAWSRLVLGLPSIIRGHIFAWDNGGTSGRGRGRQWLVDDGGAAKIESGETSLGLGTSFIDTKDFGAADGPRYLDAIKLDYECLTNLSTDAIEVLAYAREDLNSAILGSPGTEMDLSAQFVSQGTLVGGDSRLSLRTKGKFTRLRFRAASGRTRIRGFHFSRQLGGDR